MRFACRTRIIARRSSGGAWRPPISTVPPARNPFSIGVRPKPRFLIDIGTFSVIEGDGIIA